MSCNKEVVQTCRHTAPACSAHAAQLRNATASLVDGLIQEYGQIDMLHMDIQGGELELLKESKHLLKLGLLDSSCHRLGGSGSCQGSGG